MNKSKLLPVAVFIIGLVAGGVLAQQGIGTKRDQAGNRSEPADRREEIEDGGFVRFFVRVELRGTLTQTNDGATVTAMRHGYTVADPMKERPEFSTMERWTLDFTKAKELAPSAATLDGKTVLVTGWGELRELVNPPDRPGAGSSFGRAPFQAGNSSWVVGDRIVVTNLRHLGDE